jgi:hypothetical protein
MKPDEDPLATTALNFPVFDSPKRHPLPRKMTWDEVMDQTEPQRNFYMRHFDSPEKRLHNKNPAPFRLRAGSGS